MHGRSIRWWLLEGLDRLLRRVWPFSAIGRALTLHRIDRLRAQFGHPSLRKEADETLSLMAVNAAARKATRS
jgi:hypothetical protein